MPTTCYDETQGVEWVFEASLAFRASVAFLPNEPTYHDTPQHLLILFSICLDL